MRMVLSKLTLLAAGALTALILLEGVFRLLPVRMFTGDGPSDFEQAEERNLAARALAALTPKLRAVVVLNYYQGMTRDEIARTLGIPPGTVASRLGAALESMRRALAETEQESASDRLNKGRTW